MEKFIRRKLYISSIRNRKERQGPCIDMNVIMEVIKEAMPTNKKDVRTKLLAMGASSCRYHKNVRCIANVQKIEDMPSERSFPLPQWQDTLVSPDEFVEFLKELEEDFPMDDSVF